MAEITRPMEDEIRSLERRSRQQMQEIRRLLVPNLRDLARAALDPEEIAGRLGKLPPAERDQIQFRLSLALADLTSLRNAMEQYRNRIALEIHRHHTAQRAHASYAQSRQHQRPH